MAHFETFEELEIYKLARVQCQEIWKIIITTNLQQDYKLRDQINGSSGSVMDNIAEGFGRGGNREFIQFLGYSRGSNNETRAQLQRCFDREHISKETFKVLYKESEILNKQISKFMNYLKKSERKGFKYD
ncbi:four helix bundle protein [Salegentibacter sp. JZCK2]|uniref:four helix bundle protein n=1 Tax=Salegentibacter tibetensis TaxID=2873600 RepID=UPI001CCD820C|nr:four helix bundle protein [Salegentibacter tibetensis]MBZ9730265.1 four helix bundle protein [Salegentibacter tibetensis]